MSSLEQLVAAAREGRTDWSAERADRLLAVSVQRAGRAKAIRRSLGAAGAVVAVAFVLLRGGSAPAAPSTNDVHADLAVYDTTGDGGYAHD